MDITYPFFTRDLCSTDKPIHTQVIHTQGSPIRRLTLEGRLNVYNIYVALGLRLEHYRQREMVPATHGTVGRP